MTGYPEITSSLLPVRRNRELPIESRLNSENGLFAGTDDRGIAAHALQIDDTHPEITRLLSSVALLAPGACFVRTAESVASDGTGTEEKSTLRGELVLSELIISNAEKAREVRVLWGRWRPHRARTRHSQVYLPGITQNFIGPKDHGTSVWTLQ